MRRTKGAGPSAAAKREAERSVLGSMLRDNDVIGDSSDPRAGETSTSTPTRKSTRRSSASYDKGQPVDLVTLADGSTSATRSRTWAATPTSAELWDAAPTAANAEYYARIVRDERWSAT